MGSLLTFALDRSTAVMRVQAVEGSVATLQSPHASTGSCWTAAQWATVRA